MNNTPNPERIRAFTLEEVKEIISLQPRKFAEIMLVIATAPKWARYAIKNKIGAWYYTIEKPEFNPESSCWSVPRLDPIAPTLIYSGIKINYDPTISSAIAPEDSLLFLVP